MNGGVMLHPQSLTLNLDDHQPSLRQVADRLLILAQTLRCEHGVPEELADELATAATRCAHAYSHLECVLESLDLYRQQRAQWEEWLDSSIARLRRECPQPADGLNHLRPDAQGRYAWDRWEARATEAGLAQELAALGRAVMREAVQHDWTPRLKAECGWLDEGQAMLELALRDAPAAAERWDYLLATDGGRGCWGEDGSWKPFEQP
jgi:hypothetical protein